MTDTTETELTFVVASDNISHVVEDISKLERLGEYELGDERVTEIEDTYFDTAHSELQEHNVALRLRSCDGRILVTAKGPTTNVRNGLQSRHEVEMPWSPDALSAVTFYLQQFGIVLKQRSVLGDSQIDRLKSLGLTQIQVRKTQRRSRPILASSQSEFAAEISVDSTRYQLPQRVCQHYEIEIEAKSALGCDALPMLAAELLERYPGQVRRWIHSKLATGKALRELLSTSNSAQLIDEDGNVRPTTYDRIASMLNVKTT